MNIFRFLLEKYIQYKHGGFFMKCNAVILAGGRGRRLAPITDELPKPLAMIAGRSAFFRILDLLSEHGVKRCAVTVGYKADLLMAKRHEKVECVFLREERPLGTAGGVKNAESVLGDTFIVISGDSLCDFDLTAAVTAHKKSGCALTMLITESEAPFEFGTVVIDDDGFVLRFVEKPSPSELVGGLLNCGIYIMDKRLLGLIPKNKEFDFSLDLFPLLLERGERINTFLADGFWCDIGDIVAYFDCNRAALSGKVKLFGEVSLAGKGFSLGKDSGVFDSVIFDNVKIGKRSVVKSSILCDDVVVGNNCNIGEGCVIGKGAKIGNDVELPSGCRIAPKSTVFSSCGTLLGGESGIYNGRITIKAPSPSFLVKLGGALTAMGDKVAIISTENQKSVAFCVVAGVRCVGATAVDMGIGNLADLSFGIRELGCDCGVFIKSEGENVVFLLLDSDSIPPTRRSERRIGERFFEEQCSCEGGRVLSFPAREKRGAFLGFLEAQLGKPCFEVSVNEDGDEIFSKETGFFPLFHLVLLYLSTVSGEIALFPSLPTPIYTMLDERGCDVKWIVSTPSCERELEARTLAKEQFFLRDGNVLALLLGAYLRETARSLDEAIADAVLFSVFVDNVESRKSVAESVGKLLKQENCHGRREGVSMRFKDGEVTIIPTARGFRLLANAVQSETASELCSMAKDIILKL